jgi:hypothetical protein
MKPNSIDFIASSLYLNAVLPALELFPLVSTQVKNLSAHWNFSVQFGVSDTRRTLSIKEGTIDCKTELSQAPDLRIHFLNHRQLCNCFSKTGFTLPLLTRGWTRIGQLKNLLNLLSLFEEATKNRDIAVLSKEELKIFVHLNLKIMTQAFVILSAEDAISQNHLQHAPKGIVEISVPSENISAWIDLRNEIKAGIGKAPGRPDVQLKFNNLETAGQALQNKLDIPSAIGLRSIQISGLIPLLDAANLVLERIPLYLPT